MVVSIAVNYLAVLIASVASFILGMLWYGVLFGKSWMRLVGIDKKKLDKMKKQGVIKSYIIGFLSQIIMAFVLAHVIGFAQAATIIEGWGIGFLVWIGFIATVMLTSVLWEGRSVKLYVINVSYHLASFLLMSAIIILF